MRVLSTLMLTLVSVDTLAAGTLADLENSTPRNPTMQDSTRLSAGEEARINAQLYDRMMKMARNSREPSVINAYLELARKIKTGVNSRSDETIELQNRVSFYDDLLNTLPASEMRDDFYYELASSNDKLGNIDRAVELLDQMLKRFPNTRFASESHFRIAESLFSRGKFTDALREYSLVLNNGNDRYWQQAQYQLAWAYYKDGRYDDAVGPFERLIDSLQAKYQLSKGEQLRLDDSYNTLSRVTSTHRSF
jgi:tetratricopeptide (TPR) repeat protein